MSAGQIDLLSRLGWSAEHQAGELARLMACEDPDRREDLLASVSEDLASLDPQRRVYIVIARGGALAGFIRLWHSPHVGRWLNDGMVVDPRHRRAGLGLALLNRALDEARARGAADLIAHISKVNVASIALHERASFIRGADQYVNSYGYRRSGVGWEYQLAL